MITQTELNKKVDLARQLFIYNQDKMLSYLSLGSSKYLIYYKNCCLLYYLSHAVESLLIQEDGTLLLGTQTLNDDYYRKLSSLINEFVNYDFNKNSYVSDYSFIINKGISGGTVSGIPPQVTFYSPNYEDWVSYIVTVTIDDVASITVPFNISEADLESVTVMVNDNNPIPIVSSEEEGCHFINNTLYWHTYYNLKAGDKIYIRFNKIA